ncbi:hypothetical protein AB0C69_41860, partial [Actinomadura sp. NPDC048032]|uniref:hypothetical protein n=1 Tax=Actinomadura sp. NPDC048032 TaxID=3155747 RepID=UPI0033FDE6F1
EASMSKRRHVPNLEEPGLQEAIAAYQRLMDSIVPESQYCKGVREEDPEAVRVYGDIIERAAARARERAARQRDLRDPAQGAGPLLHAAP